MLDDRISERFTHSVQRIALTFVQVVIHHEYLVGFAIVRAGAV